MFQLKWIEFMFRPSNCTQLHFLEMKSSQVEYVFTKNRAVHSSAAVKEIVENNFLCHFLFPKILCMSNFYVNFYANVL